MEVVYDKKKVEQDRKILSANQYSGLIKNMLPGERGLSDLALGTRLINSAILFEENVRSFNSFTTIGIKTASYGGISTPRPIDIKEFIKKKVALISAEMEELNSVLEQTLVKGKGKVQVIDMAYSNIAAINQFVCLKESDQSEIFNHINLKFKENFGK
ncbi:hypothetical protein [Sphingobacterium faecium]|uniref:hypothetical protein n=1 Tax=Sphingobacterium faecium TaxID=34087 RepID=UPI00247AB579|nr:hypothetical protein [Sphingobacterium faecium]WGQ15608.1 hypothetical protein QG727_04180 [Sphingobacterium faecium]